MIKTIVDANIASAQAESVIIGLDDLTKIDLSSKPLAIAIGYKENILSKFGYGLFEDDLIFEDILYNNKNFNPDSMCIDRFKSLAYTRLLPVFKYVKNSSTPIIPGSKLDIYISKHDSIEKIISKNIEKTINALPIYTDYTKLMTEINSNPNVQKKSGLLLKNLYNLTNEQIRSSCKEIFEYNRDEAMKSTHFKRCVMYLDLKENH